MTITKLDSATDSTYSTIQTNTQTTSTSFDDVYEAATVIYAQPATASSATDSQIDCPASLQSYFQEAASTYGVSESLLKAVAKAESDFNSNCTSSAGAMGIMQLMPSTAQSLGVSDAYDPRENIMGGAKLLSQLLDKYNGDTSLALAAYNAGSGNVDKYGGIPPFAETQNYVSKILSYLGNDSVSTTTFANADVTTIYAQAASQGGIL